MDDLDVRQPGVLFWLPCLWLGRMLEAHAAFLEQLAHDSTDICEPRQTVEICRPSLLQ